MGTLGPKGKAERPKGRERGWGSWNGAASPLPTSCGVWGSAVSSPAGTQTHFGRRRAQKMHLAGSNFVHFQSTNARLELQNPVDYYNNKKAVLPQGNRAMPQLLFLV